MHLENDQNRYYEKKITMGVLIVLALLPVAFVLYKYHNHFFYLMQERITFEDKKQDKPPVRIAKLSSTNNLSFSFQIRNMTLSHDGKRLYVYGHDEYVYGHDRSDFAIVDVSDPDHMTLLSDCLLPKGSLRTKAAYLAETKDGKRLYVVIPNIGLIRYDVSDPKNIKLTGMLEIKNAYKITLSKDESLAYLKSSVGMTIVDLTTDAFAMSTYYNPASPGADIHGDVAVYSNSHVYMLDNLAGLLLLDVTDPENVVLETSRDIIGRGMSITISPDKRRLYVTTLDHLKVFDISDYRAPEQIGSYSIGSFIKGYGRLETLSVTNDGQTVYLPKEKGGIDIIDVKNANKPVQILTDKSRRIKATALSKDNKYIYIAYDDYNIGAFER